MKIVLSRQEGPVETCLERVCDAYVIHKVSLHRRPVYRHQHGDIELNKHGLMGLLDGRLSTFLSPTARAGVFLRCLHEEFRTDIPYSAEKEGFLFSMGPNPTLTQRATRWIDGVLQEYGDMVNEFGGAAAFDKAIMEMETEANHEG